MLTTTGQIRDERIAGERVSVDRLQLSVGRDRRRLERLVPLAQLVAPDLAFPHLFRTREPLRNLLFGDELRRSVREAVDVHDHLRRERGAVVRQELGTAAPKRPRVNLHPVPRERPREMHRIQDPRPGTRRLVLKLRRTATRHCCPPGRAPARLLPHAPGRVSPDHRAPGKCLPGIVRLRPCSPRRGSPIRTRNEARGGRAR